MLLRNIRFGLRLMRKNIRFFVLALAIQALGIAGATAIFSVVYGTLLLPLPYPHPEQLVVVWSKVQGHNNGVSAGDFSDWRDQNSVFQEIVAISGHSFDLAQDGNPEQIVGLSVTPGLFSKVYGLGPILGRDFLPQEAILGNDKEVILSHRLWAQRFHGDPAIVGKTIHADGEEYTVVGVLPAGSYDRLSAQMYSPLAFKPEQVNHDFHWLRVEARMKPGVTLAQAQSDMNVVSKRIGTAYPKSNRNWGASVEKYQNDFLARDVQRALWLLLGGIGVVLLIACSDIAGLLLAKGIGREREIAVRSALGASRRSLFTQLITESLVLALLGGILGVLGGYALLRLIVSTLPPRMLPSEADIKISIVVLLFSTGISAVSGLIFGCVPGWHFSRVSVNEGLKEGGRSTSGANRQRWRKTLVVVQIALAMTLLNAAALFIRSLINFSHTDFGVVEDHVLTFELPQRNDRFAQTAQNVAFYRELLTRLRTLPGVEDASASTGMPIRGPGFGMPFSVPTKPVSDPSSRPSAYFDMVTPEFYRAFGIRLVRGRIFSEGDASGSLPVAMVNESFVKQFLPGVDPLSQTVSVEQLIPGVTQLGPPIEWRIVGVFHNVRYGGANNPFPNWPEIDVPFWQSPWPNADIAIRTSVNPDELVPSVIRTVHSVDADLPVTDIKTMNQIFDENLSSEKFEVGLLASLAGLALFLATVGIYGVVNFDVTQRTHEIGVRMAVGATPQKVLTMILREGFYLGLIGVACGMAGVWIGGHAMKSLLWGIGEIDVATVAVVAIILLAASVVACYFPARSAIRLDPIAALRYE